MLNIGCIAIVNTSPGACHHFGEKGHANEQLLENPPVFLMAITPSAHLPSRSQEDAMQTEKVALGL